MQLTDFIQSISAEFEDVQPGALTGESEFRKLESWSSMMALIVIAKIDSDYGITITAEELAKCSTLNDLFAVAQSKAA